MLSRPTSARYHASHQQQLSSDPCGVVPVEDLLIFSDPVSHSEVILLRHPADTHTMGAAQSATFKVKLTLINSSLGLRTADGPTLTIGRVDLDGAAEAVGLLPKDRVVSVNGIDLREMRRPEAAAELKRLMSSNNELDLIIVRLGSELIPDAAIRVDEAGNPVESSESITPTSKQENVGKPKPISSPSAREKSKSSKRSSTKTVKKQNKKTPKKKEISFEIVFDIRKSKQLGFQTADGPALKIGGITKGAVMHKAGVRIGDRILSVNGIQISHLTRKEAGKTFKDVLDNEGTLVTVIKREGKNVSAPPDAVEIDENGHTSRPSSPAIKGNRLGFAEEDLGDDPNLEPTHYEWETIEGENKIEKLQERKEELRELLAKDPDAQEEWMALLDSLDTEVQKRAVERAEEVEAQAALKDVVVLTSSGEDDTDDDFDEDADAVDSSKELKHAEKKNLDSARVVDSSGSNLLDSARSSNNDTHSTPAISERSSSPVSSLNTTPVTSRSASPERKTSRKKDKYDWFTPRYPEAGRSWNRLKSAKQIFFRVNLRLKQGDRLGFTTCEGPSLSVGTVETRGPMGAVGIDIGDRIIAVNGVNISSLSRHNAAETLQEKLGTLKAGGKLALWVARVGKKKRAPPNSTPVYLEAPSPQKSLNMVVAQNEDDPQYSEDSDDNEDVGTGQIITPVCSAGHAMVFAEHSGGIYAHGWFCDGCTIVKGPRNGPRYFCLPCRQDFCEHCAKKFYSQNRGNIEAESPSSDREESRHASNEFPDVSNTSDVVPVESTLSAEEAITSSLRQNEARDAEDGGDTNIEANSDASFKADAKEHVPVSESHADSSIDNDHLVLPNEPLGSSDSSSKKDVAEEADNTDSTELAEKTEPALSKNDVPAIPVDIVAKRQEHAEYTRSKNDSNIKRANELLQRSLIPMSPEKASESPTRTKIGLQAAALKAEAAELLAELNRAMAE